MKVSLLSATMRFPSICRSAIARPLRTAALVILAATVLTVPGLAQIAHFAGAELNVRSGLSYIIGIATDQAGNVYIPDGLNARVLKETPTPSGWVESIVENNPGHPNAVAVDSAGNVYVSDSSNLEVDKYLPFGTIYIKTTVAANLPVPEWVSVDSAANVYISLGSNGPGTGSVIKEVPSGGGYIKHTVASGLNFPEGIAIDSSGNIFIADCNNNRVLKETPSGNSWIQSVFLGGLNNPQGVRADAHDNIYIVDAFNNRILKQTKSGSSYTLSIVPMASALSIPQDVAFDAAGNLYVSDGNNIGRVFELAYSGANFGQVPLYSPVATTLPMVFAFDTPGMLGNPAVKVLSQGVTSQVFTDYGNGTCHASVSYAAGQSCTVVVSISPAEPGLVQGAATLVNTAGTSFVSGPLYGVGEGPQTTYLPGFSLNVPYANSGQNSPYGVAVDGKGDVFISDSFGNRILKETRVAGGYTESVVDSALSSPAGISLDGAGNLYVADSGNGRIVEEVLTGGTYTHYPLMGNLNSPEAVAVDVSGNLFIADTLNNRILKETFTTNGYVQTTVPFTSLHSPFGVAVDGNGRIFVSDTVNDRLLTGVPQLGGTLAVTVLADNLHLPYGVTVDALGNAYVADFNGGRVIKEIANTDGSFTFTDLQTTGLLNPYALAVDSMGNVYIGDVGTAQLTIQDFGDPPTMNFAVTSASQTSSDSPKSLTLVNSGNQQLKLFAIDIDPNFTVVSGSGTLPDCAQNLTVAPGSACNASVSFTPGAVAGLLTSTLYIQEYSPGLIQKIPLTGTSLPVVTLPVSGSTLTGPVATFAWTSAGAGSSYALVVGTTGPGSKDVFNSGVTSQTSTYVTGIPTFGAPLYARLGSKVGGKWYYSDYKYTQFGTPEAVLTLPVNGSTLGGPTVGFAWNSGYGVSAYVLNLGTTGPGSYNVLHGASTTINSYVVQNIPTTGAPLYARLSSKINGVWSWNDYVYTQAGATKATMISPAPNSTLGGSTVLFSWNAGYGVAGYALNVGTTGPGSSDFYQGSLTTAHVTQLSNLPTYGAPLYVRLSSKINGVWQYVDYAYKESGTAVLASITSPIPSGVLPGTSATFTWNTGGGVSAYSLFVGTTGVASSNVYKGLPTTALSAAVTSLPTGGGTVYVRLGSKANGVWQYKDYTYTAAP